MPSTGGTGSIGHNPSFEGGITRRTAIGRTLAGSAALAAGRLLAAPGPAAAAPVPPWPSGLPASVVGRSSVNAALLPSSRRLYEDIKNMNDMGPRFTGSDAHNRYIDWLKAEFEAAGCKIQQKPADVYPFQRWLAEDWALELLDGPRPGPVRVASYYPYGGETPPQGVVGHLVYAGRAPAPRITGDPSDAAGTLDAIRRYRQEFADWLTTTARDLPNAATGAGNILLVDIDSPPPLTEGEFFSAFGPAEYYSWPGGDWQTRNFKRMWLAGFTAVGGNIGSALGAVYIVDGSYAAAAGNYSPFGGAHQNFPALYVDRDTGAMLRRAAASKPRVRFTMTASKANTTSANFVAVLPGKGNSGEVMIANTHTDGPNFVEENGGVGLVNMARYFSHPSTRLNRTLVFSCVTGHFGPGFPQTQGFIDNYPEYISAAAAGLTVEHFGCNEWWDDSHGYHATGWPEVYAIYHALTPIALPVIDSMAASGLIHEVVTKGVWYLGIGSNLEDAGVPAVSFIAGPNYLVATGPTQTDGFIRALNPDLAAQQVRWCIDLLGRLDSLPREQLSAGDTTAFTVKQQLPPAPSVP